MKRLHLLVLILILPFLQGCDPDKDSETKTIDACAEALLSGPRAVADDRADRFQGKVSQARALCRGGQKAADGTPLPWVDWSNYYGTAAVKPSGLKGQIGLNGALLDLEFQRLELIKFNLFENSGTFRDYILGR